MIMRETGWRYYLPDHGGTADDATPIMTWNIAFGFGVLDAEHAARLASEDEWDCGGWEAGVGEIDIVVISPTGVESAWVCTREAEVVHTAEPK